MKKKHMKKINSLSVLQVEKRENLMFKMRKDIFTEKIYSVTDYLKKEKFLMINIEQGPDSWARALSVKIHGNQNKFMRVKWELYK